MLISSWVLHVHVTSCALPCPSPTPRVLQLWVPRQNICMPEVISTFRGSSPIAVQKKIAKKHLKWACGNFCQATASHLRYMRETNSRSHRTCQTWKKYIYLYFAHFSFCLCLFIALPSLNPGLLLLEPDIHPQIFTTLSDIANFSKTSWKAIHLWRPMLYSILFKHSTWFQWEPKSHYKPTRLTKWWAWAGFWPWFIQILLEMRRFFNIHLLFPTVKNWPRVSKSSSSAQTI